MAITVFWICLSLGLICALISESIQVWRQKKYIKLLSESTGIVVELNNLSNEEQLLRAGIRALELHSQGLNEDYFITYGSLLDEMADELAGQPASEKIKQVRAEIKQRIKNGTTVICKLNEKADKRRATQLLTDAFNCKVEGSLLKLKSTNVGHIIAEIKNAFDIINMNAIGLQTSIDKGFLNLRLEEAKLGSILHEQRELLKEEQRALREEMREEERANRERERLAKEAEREEKIKEEMLKAAQDAATNASEAERAIFEERVRQLEAEVDAAKAKVQKVSMAQVTRVGTVYIISNIGSFGEGILKIGMTRRLEPKDRIDELGSASVPFEFDIHALINSVDAPKLENELHKRFEDRRVNKINLKKEFFEVTVSEVKEVLEEMNLYPQFTMVAEAAQYRDTQRINSLPREQRLEIEHKIEQQQREVADFE